MQLTYGAEACDVDLGPFNRFPAANPAGRAASVRRAVAAAGLARIALIHLLDLNDKLKEVASVGVVRIGLVVVSLVIAEALTRTNDPRGWITAGTIAGATILGYAGSRTAGVPGDHGAEVGNWLEPLGVSFSWRASLSCSPRPPGRSAHRRC
jgi:hypothetical protein